MFNKPSLISRHCLYLAAPLFSDAEREFNQRISNELKPYFEVHLPQENGPIMSELLCLGLSVPDAVAKVFENDVIAIRNSEVILAVLDGRSVDEGVAFELGYAFALGKHCVALQTDLRRMASFGNNPMLTGALSDVFASIDEMVRWSCSYVQQNKQNGEGGEKAASV